MKTERYLQAAFDAVCEEAKPAEGHYVCLMESVPYYGGPEEGGWWGRDTNIVAYQYFATAEQAEAAKEAVEKMAQKMSNESKREFGKQCLREMEWLDTRGLDADYLPEPDGESEFYVIATTELPLESRGCRQYS
jgi:glycogen debranching enzyme